MHGCPRRCAAAPDERGWRSRPSQQSSGALSGDTMATFLNSLLHPTSLGQVGDQSANARFVALVDVSCRGALGPLDEGEQLLADHVTVLQHDDVASVVDQD